MSKRELEKIQKDLSEIEGVLSELNKQYEAAMAEKRALQDEAELMERRLTAAAKLITGLASEKDRYSVLCTHIVMTHHCPCQVETRAGRLEGEEDSSPGRLPSLLRIPELCRSFLVGIPTQHAEGQLAEGCPR